MSKYISPMICTGLITTNIINTIRFLFNTLSIYVILRIASTVKFAWNLKLRFFFLGHIGIHVPDVDATCARCETLGVEFIKKPNDGKSRIFSSLLNC